MNSLKNCITLLLIVTAAFAQAQSKKLVRTYGIKSMTETTVKVKDGEEVSQYVSETEKYDLKTGEWIEKIAYNKDGSWKRIEKRTYERGEIVDESVEEEAEKAKDAKPVSYKREIYEFDKGDLLKKQELDREGNVMETIEYTYDKYGEKIGEVKRDEEGNIEETEEFLYDARGLKTTKNTYNEKGELVEIKRYTYAGD